MPTYGQFYNPKKPDNRMVLLILGFTVAFILCMLFIGCNSVKKSTKTEISKSDSSSVQKVDSSAKTETNTTETIKTLKTWDRETVVEFYNKDSMNNTYADFVSNNPWWVVEDGKISISGANVKSIVTRLKGKDSGISIVKDLSKSTVNLNKESGTAVKTFEKTKNKEKETARSNTILFAILGAFALVLLYLKFRK